VSVDFFFLGKFFFFFFSWHYSLSPSWSFLLPQLPPNFPFAPPRLRLNFLRFRPPLLSGTHCADPPLGTPPHNHRSFSPLCPEKFFLTDGPRLLLFIEDRLLLWRLPQNLVLGPFSSLRCSFPPPWFTFLAWKLIQFFFVRGSFFFFFIFFALLPVPPFSVLVVCVSVFFEDRVSGCSFLQTCLVYPQHCLTPPPNFPPPHFVRWLLRYFVPREEFLLGPPDPTFRGSIFPPIFPYDHGLWSPGSTQVYLFLCTNPTQAISLSLPPLFVNKFFPRKIFIFRFQSCLAFF